MISSFSGRYRFLSNFYSIAVELDGETYASVEHAYQAAKTRAPEERARIRRARAPGAAKHLGRRVTLRPDWEKRKIEVMRRLVRQKFYCHSDLGALLVRTGDEELVEGNYWHDTFWGQCPLGCGFNHLGMILMEVRKELRGNS